MGRRRVRVFVSAFEDFRYYFRRLSYLFWRRYCLRGGTFVRCCFLVVFVGFLSRCRAGVFFCLEIFF